MRPIRFLHRMALAWLLAVCGLQATAQVLQQVVRDWPINTVVHNAGLIRAALLPDVRLSDLDDLTQLHLACAIQMVQAALPTMQAQQFGRVVLLSSRAAVGLATLVDS